MIWTGAAGVALILLGLHDIARQSTETLRHPPYLSLPVILFAASALFIAHHLVAPADQERRRIANYPAYFDTASKAVVQLALSIGFTAAFWVLLQLGAALFRIIGLDFLQTLLRREWFAIPVTFLVFATAVHLTDVRDGLIRGVRTVGLMLLSWLLLVITLLVAGFIAALPFTGVQGLWETRSATALVLAAAAALIILINAAYQDGQPDNRPPAILRAAVRVAAVLIAPLVVIAFWGLVLRIGQYGLTPDRITAAAFALVGAVFAVGYGWAALSPLWRKGEWMRPLERTTITAAFMTVAVILALFSPIADPARLSVANQVARLARGDVAPARFDYRFLRWNSGKAGRAALARLTRSDVPEIARRAQAAERDDRRVAFAEAAPAPPLESLRIRVNPAGAVMPASFRAQFDRLPSLRRCEGGCEARMVDLDHDGADEVLVAGSNYISVFRRELNGLWLERAVHRAPVCESGGEDLAAALASDRVVAVPSPLPDLTVGGMRLRQEPGALECPAPPVIPPAP